MSAAAASTAPEKTSQARVACDGGGGPLGHPKVYLTFGEKPSLDCPYCGKTFVFEGKHKH